MVTNTAMQALSQLLAHAEQCLRGGALDEAERACRKALMLVPGQRSASFILGVTLLGKGDARAAVDHLRAAARGPGRDARVHVNLGIALERLGDMQAAIASYRRACTLAPQDAMTHARLGAALRRAGRLADAVASLERAIRLDPRLAHAHNALGVALAESGRRQEALERYRRAIELDPSDAVACSNLGEALAACGDVNAALEAFDRAVALGPENGSIHCNRALVLLGAGRASEAIEGLSRAVACDPSDASAHLNLACALLGSGQFTQGWREYEWRVPFIYGTPYLSDPRTGAPLAKPSQAVPIDLHGRSVLLIGDQGLGDQINFLRFAPLARARGATLSFVGSDRLAAMLTRCGAVERVYAGDERPEGYDLAFGLTELPLALDIARFDDLPPPLALSPCEQATHRLEQRLAQSGVRGPILCVTWRAGVDKDDRARWTIPKLVDPGALGQALRAWHGEIVIVQRAPRRDEIDRFTAALGRPAHDLSDLNDDLEALLALMHRADDYVAVSNTAAYLRAGAGRPARILATGAPMEWLLGYAGDRTAWLPHFRIYRRGPQGDTAAPLAALGADLNSTDP